MSYITGEVLKNHNLTEDQLDSLPQDKQDQLLFEAVSLKENLWDAVQWFENLIAQFRDGIRDEGLNRLSLSEDPNSSLGKQIMRLCAFDMPRAVLERKFGISIAMYNCCKVIVAWSKWDLHMSVAEQLKLQQTADC